MAVHQLCTVTMTSASAWRYPQRRGLRRENKKAPRGAACGHLDSPASGRFFETRTQADAVWSRGTADRDHRSYLAACDGQGLEPHGPPRPDGHRRRAVAMRLSASPHSLLVASDAGDAAWATRPRAADGQASRMSSPPHAPRRPLSQHIRLFSPARGTAPPPRSVELS